MKEVEKILAASGITATPVRILVLRCLKESKKPMSLSDLESALETVDKSTISRTLSTLKEKDLLHSFNDGSGSIKYELCHCQNHENHNDLHVHFRCEVCGETQCLTSVSIPDVKLPDGYIMRDANFVIAGVCSNCNAK